MLDGIGTIFNVIIAVLALSATAAGVAAVFRANWAKSQIEFLEKNVKLRDDRITILEADNTSMSRDIEIEKQKVIGLTQQVKVLEDIVTGKEQLEHLQTSLDTYAKQNKEVHDAILENQKELLKTIRLLRTARA